MSAHAAHKDAHDDGHDAHDGPHVTPLPIYFAVFGTLLVLTVVTVWIAQFDFGAANTLIAMLVATVKATLVAAIFMHLLYEERLNTLAFVFGLLFVSLFFIFTMLDVFTRKHIDPARANNGVEASDVLALELEVEKARENEPAPVLGDQAAVPEDERSAMAPPSAPAPVVDGVVVKVGMQTAGRRLLLTGTVASEDVLQGVLAAANAAVGESNVTSRVRVDPSVTTPDWIKPLSAAFSSIKGVRGLGLEATASKLVMTGRADTAAIKDQAGLALNAAVTGIPIDNRIKVKPAGDEALDRVNGLMAGVDGATYFAENAAEINASAHPTLNSLGDMLFEIPGVHLQVGAYSDPGSGESKALTQQRADALVAYLVKLGVEPSRLKAVGFGPRKAAGAQTRRVEYVVLGADGSPYSREMIVELDGDKIVIYESVYFQTGKAIIKPESRAVLDKVAAVFQSQPQIKKVEIQGHTDASGDAEKNKQLSQERADAVRTYLMAQGVAGDRLTAVGIGQEQPIAPNDTPAGRDANRRVEFKILEQ